MVSLETLHPGVRGEILHIGHCGACGGKCHDHGQSPRTTRAEKLGLRTGRRIEILKNDGIELLLRVDGERIAIDRHMAMKIMVRQESGPCPACAGAPDRYFH